MKNIKKAFTLAEVLLVVAIVGVIAAMAIPNLNKSIGEDKKVMLFRNTTEQLNAALGKVISEYGSYDNANKEGCPDSKNVHYCATLKMTSYLDVGYNCGDTNKDKCFSSKKITLLGGSDEELSNGNEECDYTFLLANGVGVCNRYGIFELDLDGPNNGPNSRGIDLFRLDRVNDVLAPEPSHEISSTEESATFIDFAGYDRYNQWLFEIGNMDYLKCPNTLNWVNKHTCD